LVIDGAEETGKAFYPRGANFALPCAVDCVKRQQFRAWKGGRVV
jgi:hypothetical protein